MRIDRMLAITIILLNRKKISAKELADRFEVSVRTIYRDMESINMAGIPIVSHQGNDGGFCLMEHYKIDRQFLTLKDIGAILTALDGINSTLQNTQISETIEKIKSLGPKDKHREPVRNYQQIVFDIIPWGGGKDTKTKLGIIHSAIDKKQVIVFDYTNLKGETLERRVEPMTLIFKGYGWYLHAFCQYRRDFRLFRLTRLKNLIPLNIPFIRREVPIEQNRSLPESQAETEIILRFTQSVKTWVLDSFEEEKITELNTGYLIVRTKIKKSSWLLPMILSYGDQVEVLEPEEIRKKIRHTAEKISRIYQT